MAENNVINLTIPVPDRFNVQGKKRYVFNQTGNIMMSSTDNKTESIPESVRDVFAEVSVFFAAMTKSISQTKNPNGKKDEKGELPYYNLYNYDAIEAIVDGSGYFIHVTEQDLNYETNEIGANFSKDLISGVLGIATGGAALAFAAAMISSIGKEAINISAQKSSLNNKVANIIFVCEYLMGMPLVNAIVITADASKASETFQAGPCFSGSHSKTSLKLHKDTYMFVTPKFIKQYAGELNTEMNNPDYLRLIEHLQSLLKRESFLIGIFDKENKEVSDKTEVISGAEYIIVGEYLGTDGDLSLGSPEENCKITKIQWNEKAIHFKIDNASKEKINSSVKIKIKSRQIELNTITLIINPKV